MQSMMGSSRSGDSRAADLSSYSPPDTPHLLAPASRQRQSQTPLLRFSHTHLKQTDWRGVAVLRLSPPTPPTPPHPTHRAGGTLGQINSLEITPLSSAWALWCHFLYAQVCTLARKQYELPYECLRSVLLHGVICMITGSSFTNSFCLGEEFLAGVPYKLEHCTRQSCDTGWPLESKLLSKYWFTFAVRDINLQFLPRISPRSAYTKTQTQRTAET